MARNTLSYSVSVVDAFTVHDPRIMPEPNTGCWLWMGRVEAKGYGATDIVRAGKWRNSRAHRVVWEQYCGPIPVGMVIDHVCRVRSCVNPDHLRVVTPRQNTLENSMGPAARHRAQQNCPKCGGVYFVTSEGRRRCRPCTAIYQRAWSLSRKPECATCERPVRAEGEGI